MPAWQTRRLNVMQLDDEQGGYDMLATVRVRYRRRDTGKVEEIEQCVLAGDVLHSFDQASARFRLAACVAELAEILRGSPFAAGSRYPDLAQVLRPVAMELHLDAYVQELLRISQVAGGMSRGE